MVGIYIIYLYLKHKDIHICIQPMQNVYKYAYIYLYIECYIYNVLGNSMSRSLNIYIDYMIENKYK